MRRSILIFISIFTAAIALASDQNRIDEADDYDVYLLIGQSNMAGRGIFHPADTLDIIDGVWLLDSDGKPVPAKAPLNRYSTIRKDISIQGYNPGVTFSGEMHRKTGRKILLVVNARGGSHVAQWQPESADGYFNEAVRRSRQAMRYGELKGILWNQGETDVERRTPDYTAKFNTMITSLRDSLDAASVPVVVGQVGTWKWNDPAEIAKFNNTTIPEVCRVVPLCRYVSSEGLERRFANKERDPHYSREAQMELGRRYAAVILEMMDFLVGKSKN